MKKGTDIFYERHHDENKNICIFADGAHCDLHFHRSIEVLLLTEGEVKAEVGEQTFLAQMDEIIFVHNYYPHRLTLLGGPFRKIVLIIPPSFSDDFDRAFRQSTLPALLDDRAFNRTLLPLFESLAAEKQGSSLILKGYLNVLFGKLLDHYPTVPIRLDRNVDLMARILRYIDCHYTEKLTLDSLAQEKNATPAQISLAWMLHKYPNVVPIPGSKNKERILENLDAAQVELTEEEFSELETALNRCKVYGHRGFTR